MRREAREALDPAKPDRAIVFRINKIHLAEIAQAQKRRGIPAIAAVRLAHCPAIVSSARPGGDNPDVTSAIFAQLRELCQRIRENRAESRVRHETEAAGIETPEPLRGDKEHFAGGTCRQYGAWRQAVFWAKPGHAHANVVSFNLREILLDLQHLLRRRAGPQRSLAVLHHAIHPLLHVAHHAEIDPGVPGLLQEHQAIERAGKHFCRIALRAIKNNSRQPVQPGSAGAVDAIDAFLCPYKQFVAGGQEKPGEGGEAGDGLEAGKRGCRRVQVVHAAFGGNVDSATMANNRLDVTFDARASLKSGNRRRCLDACNAIVQPEPEPALPIRKT